MRGSHLRCFILSTFACLSAHAQTLEGFDVQGAPLPLNAQSGSVLESAQAPGAKAFQWTYRTSFVTAPLSLRLPTPAPEGASAPAIRSMLLGELSATVGLTEGFDAGFSFGAHLHQSGAQVGEDPTQIAPFGARDPRLGVAWATVWHRWAIRPFAQMTIPLGNTDALAGEETPRLEGGVAWTSPGTRLRWASELAFLYRTPQEISSSTLGPQLLFGTGLHADVLAPLTASLEFMISPFLSRQRTLSGASGGRLLPAELLLGIRYSEQPWSVGVAGGSGLPLSQASEAHSERPLQRGPTAPAFRGFFDVRFEK